MRLSSLATLPPAAVPHLQWAWDRVKEERTTQLDILAGLNARLKGIGVKPVSKSALNRWVLAIRHEGLRRPALIAAAWEGLDS